MLSDDWHKLYALQDACRVASLSGTDERMKKSDCLLILYLEPGAQYPASVGKPATSETVWRTTIPLVVC